MTDMARTVFRARPDTDTARFVDALKLSLEAGGNPGVIDILADTAALVATLDRDPATRLCQLYTAPERLLSLAIAEEKPVEPLLEEWVREATDLLSLHRRNRQRSTIFEAAHFLRYPEVGLARLDLPSPDQPPLSPPPPPPAIAPVFDLIARARVHAHPDANRLREELEASAETLSNDAMPDPLLVADLALQHHRAQTLQLAEAELARVSTQEQNRLLRTSFATLRGEADRQAAELRHKVQEVERFRQARVEDVRTRDAHIAQLKEALKAMAADSEAYRSRSQSDLKARDTQARDALTTREARISELEAALRAAGGVEARLTQDIRALRTQVKSLSHAEATARQKIAAAQQTIDKLNEKAARTAAKTKDLGAKLDGLRQRKRSLRATLRTERRATLESRETAQQLTQEIDRILNSLSMRLTKPLRWISARIRRHPNG